MFISKKIYLIHALFLLSFVFFGNNVYADTIVTATRSGNAIEAPGTTITLTANVTGSDVGKNCWYISTSASTPTSSTSCWITIPTSGALTNYTSTFKTGPADTNTYYIFLCTATANTRYCSQTIPIKVQNYAFTASTATPAITAIGGGSVALNVTTNMTMTGTDYYIRFYDSANIVNPNYLGGGCGTGNTCSYVASVTSSKTYTVIVENLNGSIRLASTNITVTVPVDTTAPGVPTLSSTGASISSIGLSWGLVIDNIGVVAYDIHKCAGMCTPDPSASPVPLATVPVASGTKYTDTGLSPNSTYSYLVRVRDAAGNASVSNTSTGTTFADTTPPSPQPTVTPTPSSLSQINLSWNASTDSESGLAPYELYSCSGSGALCTPNTSGTPIYTGTAITYPNTGLSPGITYGYRVVAKDNANNVNISNTAYGTIPQLLVTPTISWSLDDITYGDPLSSTQQSATSGGVAGTFAYAQALRTVLQSGSQTLSVTFTPTNTTNYNSVTKTTMLVVNKKVITVTAENKTKVQGTANPVFTAKYTGLTNGDTTGTLNELASFSTTATTNSVEGTYTITPSGAVASNYSFSYVNGVLTVTAVPKTNPVISWSNPANITYGTALSAKQLNATANVPGTFSYTSPLGTVLNADTVNIGVTFTPTDTASYNTASGFITLIIDKKALTIKADDKTMVKGATVPLLTASYSGFITGDNASKLTRQVTLDLNAPPANLGTYTISPSVLALSPNYAITHVNGVLTVTAVPKTNPVISWSNPANIIYGTALSEKQLNATANVPGTFSYTSPLGTVLNADTVNIRATFTPTDTASYNTVAKEIALVVIKKALTITADDKTRVYAATNPTLTAKTIGLVGIDTLSSIGVTPSLSTDSNQYSPVGTYPIFVTGISTVPNYNITYISGTLSVTKILTLTASLTVYPSVSSGTITTASPMFSKLTAESAGTATGAITYQFKCKESDTYTTSPGRDYNCSYTAIGTYVPSVKVSQGGLTATGFGSIRVIADIVPPTFTDIKSVDTTKNSTKIEWTTNESATSQVEYGETLAYGNITPKFVLDSKKKNDGLLAQTYGKLTTENPALTTLHSVLLTNLIENKVYNYRVISKDALSNTRISPNQIFKTALPNPAGNGDTKGWAWSSTIGWISFNGANANSDGGLYAVKFDNSGGSTMGKLTQYAWSSNIGWIQFSGLSGFPTGPGTVSENVTINTEIGNPNFGSVTGWARVLSGLSSSGSSSQGSQSITDTYFCKSVTETIPGNLRWNWTAYSCSTNPNFTIINDASAASECNKTDVQGCPFTLNSQMPELKRYYCPSGIVADTSQTSFTCTRSSISGSSSSGGDWDGWISMSGINHLTKDPTGNGGVTYVTINTLEDGINITRGYLKGYAWGGEVVGWVSFNIDIGNGVTGVCVVNCLITSNSSSFSLLWAKNITVNLENLPAIIYTSGQVQVGRNGLYNGTVTLSAMPASGSEGSRLPAGVILKPLTGETPGASECSLSDTTQTCTLNVSIEGVTLANAGPGYYVSVKAVDSVGNIKYVFVPIDMLMPSNGIKMWLNDDISERQELIKIKYGDTVKINWKKVDTGSYTGCKAYQITRGTAIELNNFNSAEKLNQNPYLIHNLPVGNHTFSMSCNKKGITQTNTKGLTATDSETMQINVSKSKIKEI